ncbi:MAG TPA: DNA repair protein RecN [Chthoniobacterales bacterium]
MLTSLRIRNLALVEHLEWHPAAGYTAITGETGAGKSIILGALKLLLGDRADKTLMRSGADTCTVEAVFSLRNGDTAALNRDLEEQGIDACEDGQLLLKRSFTAAGTNRQFINGSAATLATLKRLGDDLVDLHGPHDHQSLFSTARQLSILDRFAAVDPSKYEALFHKASDLRGERDELATSERAVAQEIDLLQFQKREIDDAALDAAEAAADEQRYTAFANSKRILETGAAILDALAEAEGSILARHTDLHRHLRDLERLDSSIVDLSSRHSTLVEELEDIAQTLQKRLDSLDLDPEQIQALEDRVNLLQTLRRKYGPTIEDVIAFGQTVTARLEKITGRDAELARLDAELAATTSEMLEAGAIISAVRKKAAGPLGKKVTSQLRDLGFKQSSFEIVITPSAEPRSTGLETVEFLFAPNPGEPAKPLRTIASSGEISRVMLAVKSALAGQDAVPLLVFDEVDANVGGEIAHAVGEKMRSLGEKHQVLTITHLPQVAARAASHFVVSKHVESGRTLSRLTEVTQSERIAEIARMLGGQSDSARQHAEALLEGRR